MTNGKRGPLFVILFAALMAGAGNGISIVAFPWLVLQRNGSALDARSSRWPELFPARGDVDRRRRGGLPGPQARFDDSDALSALSVAAVPVSR